MKFEYLERITKGKDNDSNWKKYVLTPFVLGLTFGAGCYVAKVILNTPVMKRIVSTTVKVAQQQADKLRA